MKNVDKYIKKGRKLYSKHLRVVQTIVFILIFGFTFILRAHNYEKNPGIGHLEEQMYGWAGQYLIEEGAPVAWSSLDYPDKNEVYRGEINYHGEQPVVHVRLYKPWFDQPPLYSLISGWFSHTFGADRHMVLPNAYIRIPSVLMAALTGIFIFLIARAVSGFWMGSLAMLMYGTIPIFVFGSRLSVAENFVALLFSIIVYLLIKYHQNQRFKYILLIPILVGLAGLSKPTGYFLMPFAAFFALQHRQWKHLLYITLGIIPFLLIWISYGNHFDASLFWQIQSTQSNRPVGFAGLAWFFVSPAYDIFTLTDSWYIFCLLSTAYFLFNPDSGKKRIVGFAFLYWLSIVIISGGETDLLPWYRYPAFPFLAIMGAWGVKELFTRINFFSSLLAVTMFMGSRVLLYNPFRWSIPPTLFRQEFSTLMLPAVFSEFYRKEWLLNLCRGVMVFAFLIGMFWNVVFIYNNFELKCENQTCPTGPTTKLSELYFPVIYRFFVLGPEEKH